MIYVTALNYAIWDCDLLNGLPRKFNKQYFLVIIFQYKIGIFDTDSV